MVGASHPTGQKFIERGVFVLKLKYDGIGTWPQLVYACNYIVAKRLLTNSRYSNQNYINVSWSQEWVWWNGHVILTCLCTQLYCGQTTSCQFKICKTNWGIPYLIVTSQQISSSLNVSRVQTNSSVSIILNFDECKEKMCCKMPSFGCES